MEKFMASKFVKTYTRRDFLATAAVSTLAINYLPRRVWGANERLQFGGIGVGGKGSSDIDHCGNLGNVVAICDIDDNRLNSKGEQFAQARKFHDFREMLSSMGDKIDAVTVSTADHTHAPAAAMAMRMGIHVYCQKPLTHTVAEARLLRDLARKHKVATQMGNQGTASGGFRRGVEMLQSGAIGRVREAHVWTNRPVWPQSPQVRARPSETPPVPQHVKWDLFLGPAPVRPYHSAYHPFNWRGWWDFGTGALGDMACHTANLAFMGLKLGTPVRVSAQNEPLNPETFPGWATVEFDFPARWELAPVKMIWYEGRFADGTRNYPPQELFHGEEISNSGSLFVGDKGILYSPGDMGTSYKLLPEGDFEGYQPPGQWIPRIERGDQGMKDEWVAAIQGGRPALSNFEYAGPMNETILLGNLAMQIGQSFDWDGDKLHSSNRKAKELAGKEYRSGWDPYKL
jgi:predicted dehydrogenase